MQKVEVKPSYGLAEGEIERMIRDSFEHGKADMEERLLRESKSEAERLLVSLKPALEKYTIDKAQYSAFMAKISELEKALTQNNRNQIDKIREELNSLSETLAEQIMNEGVSGVLKGKKVDEV